MRVIWPRAPQIRGSAAALLLIAWLAWIWIAGAISVAESIWRLARWLVRGS